MSTTQLHNHITDIKERLMQQLPSSDEIMEKFEARIPMTPEEMQQEMDHMYDFDYMLTIIDEMGHMVDDGLITTPEQIEKIYNELSAQRSIYDLVVNLYSEFYTDGIHGIREIIQLIMSITDKANN